MKKIWCKTLTALVLALTLLAGCMAGVSAEDADAAVVAELTDEAEPVLLASVNGDEVWSNNEEMMKLITYYLNYYANYGYDTSDPSLQAYLKAAGMQWAIEDLLYRQKAKELGVPEMTDEQKISLEADAKAEWEEAVNAYAEYLGGVTESSTEEEIKQARVTALAYIEANFGYNEESYVAEYLESSRSTQLRRNVQEAVLGKIDVTEDEVTAYFNELVEEDKGTYEGNVPMYEYYTNYMGSKSYYVPEGYRGITHILLEVDPDLMDRYSGLTAQLEEQKEDASPDEKTGEEPQENDGTAENGSETAEAAEPAEPVTQEMVDAARQAILDSVTEQVNEIMDAYKAGTPFGELIEKYGTDPGMKQEPYKTDGYAVHKDSILWEQMFTDGAMTLKQVGDVSEPILGSRGIHILHYLRDIPAGAVELTDEIRSELKDELLSEKENTAVTAMVEEWRNAAEIIYTEEGQAILDAAKAEEEATVDTTEATEEALTD